MGGAIDPSPIGALGAYKGRGVIGQGLGDLGGDITNPLTSNGGLFGQTGATPDMANIQRGTSVEDVKNAQQNVGNSIESQNRLLQALQAQNGMGYQSGLMGQLAGANGVGLQQGAASGLANAAQAYQNIASGQGPNPAQAMLNQETGRNVANQAALMAGQRGAGANIGLLARQAAQQGANAQQQAVGQGATMQANQQLNALQGMTGANQALAGVGSGLTNAQQSMANQLAGQQIGATNANTQAALANAQNQQNALAGLNTASTAAQGNVNAGNVALSQSNTQAKQAIAGGILQGAGSAGGMMKAHGGLIHMDEGGEVPSAIPETPAPATAAPVATPPAAQAASGPQSSFGKMLSGMGSAMQPNAEAYNQYGASPHYGSDMLMKGIGAMAPSMDKVKDIMSIASLSKGGLANEGGKVHPKKESQKAIKKGDSYDNDKIPAMLSEGEIVLPRSVTQSKDPVRASADFVSKVLAKRRAKK